MDSNITIIRTSNPDAKKGVESRANKLSHENRRIQVDLKERDEEIKRHRRDLDKRNETISDLKKELKQATEKVRGVTNMEWKAMEYEKVNIMNENLKQKLDSQLTHSRDLERRLRDRDKQIEEKDLTIAKNLVHIEELNEKMLDLRLQVREEAVKNSRLDQKLEEYIDTQRQLTEKETQAQELTSKLEKTEALLQHAKKSWKDERDKIKIYEDVEKGKQTLFEEVEFTRSENMTLKTLVVAKDTILIQKSQVLENLKNLLHRPNRATIDVETVKQILDSKPAVKPSFPKGNKIKQQYLPNGDSTTNGWAEETDEYEGNDKKDCFTKSGRLFQTILNNDDDKQLQTCRPTTGRRPQTAIVKPHNYVQTTSFSNFRSESSDAIIQSSAYNSGGDSTNRTDTSSSSKHQIKRSHTTKDRPAISSKKTPKHHNNQNNNRNYNGNVDKSDNFNGNSKCDISNDMSRLRRSKSVDNRISPSQQDNDTFRTQSPTNYSYKSLSVSTVVSSSGTLVSNSGTGSISAVLLRAAPQKDRFYTRMVRTGDRVVVDMAKIKEKRRDNYMAGVIKFIGNLDKEYDCYRIYIGVKLDDPNGDTDGLYKGKRYFKVPFGHGKFLRITKIVSIYNKDSCKYEAVEERLNDYRSDDQPVTSSGTSFSTDNSTSSTADQKHTNDFQLKI